VIEIDEEYTLDFDDPSFCLPDGTISWRANNIEVGEEEMDSIVILSPTWGDLRDVTEDGWARTKGRVCKENDGVLVTKPRFTHMYTDGFEDIYEQLDESYPAMQNGHTDLAHRLRLIGKDKLLKTVKYNMPEGMQIKADPFNGSGGEYNLQNNIVWLMPPVGKKEDGVKIDGVVPHVLWHACIVGRKRVIKAQAKATEDEGQKSLSRMLSKMKMDK
jgi:hypothetical protein